VLQRRERILISQPQSMLGKQKRRQGKFPAAFSFGTTARWWSPATSGRFVISGLP